MTCVYKHQLIGKRSYHLLSELWTLLEKEMRRKLCAARLLEKGRMKYAVSMIKRAVTIKKWYLVKRTNIKVVRIRLKAVCREELIKRKALDSSLPKRTV